MKRITTYLVVLVLFACSGKAQHLSSPQAIGMGAYTAVARDLAAIDWNPAGLIFIRDWEMRFNSFLEFRYESGSSGPYFGDGTIGKRFSDTHAFAVRYAPGLTRDFSFATAKIFRESP